MSIEYTPEMVNELNELADEIIIRNDISFWKDRRGFCMKVSNEDAIYVYDSEGALFKALRNEFKLYNKEGKNA